MAELAYGCHMNDVVVLRDGVRLLGLQDSVPRHLVEAVASSRTVRQFLDAVPAERAAELKARLYYSEPTGWSYGKERELTRTGRGDKLLSLADKRDELRARRDIADRHMYVGELRALKKYRHQPSGEWVKTAALTDVKDVLSDRHWRSMMYWDRCGACCPPLPVGRQA